jgi:hypothetical protein
MLHQHPSLSLYQGIEFPPDSPDVYFEPNGNEYGHYNEWDKVQEDIDQLQQLHQQEYETTATGLAASSAIETESTAIANRLQCLQPLPI